MRYIRLDENNKVSATREGQSIVEGEIESETGEIGQIMQPDGSFIDDPTPIIPPIPQPTNAEIQDTQMAILSGIFDIYMAQTGM